ncbi:MAG: hypothetical protein ACFB21_14545, partial [Opitutales bacterium]
TAALIVGSSIIMAATVNQDTTVGELFKLPAVLGTAGYLISALTGFWTIFDIIRHGKHKQKRKS